MGRLWSELADGCLTKVGERGSNFGMGVWRRDRIRGTDSGGDEMIGKLTCTKAMALAIPTMILTATGAWAGTGNVPAGAQVVVHGAIAHSSVSNASKAKGPDATGPAKHGLCKAFAARAGHAKGHSVAFKNLQKAASTAGKSVTQFCAGVKPGTSAPDDTGSSGATPLENHPGGDPKGDHKTPAGSPTSTPAETS